MGLAALQPDTGDSPAEQAVDSLYDVEQQQLLLILIKMIRHLQESDAIPVQRMCVTCRYFAPIRASGYRAPPSLSFRQRGFRPARTARRLP